MTKHEILFQTWDIVDNSADNADYKSNSHIGDFCVANSH